MGQPHAYLIHQKGFCLEEYIEFLQQYPDDGTPLTVEYEGCSYEIWYCAESDIHYPETGSYSVSLDNCGGAIITVRHG